MRRSVPGGSLNEPGQNVIGFESRLEHQRSIRKPSAPAEVDALEMLLIAEQAVEVGAGTCVKGGDTSAR
jgi:hypothetical protein